VLLHVWLASMVLITAAPASRQLPGQRESCAALSPSVPPHDSVQRYLWTLPPLRCRAYQREAARLDTEMTTQGMVEAIDQATNELRPLVLALARYYPPGQFGSDPQAYIDSVFRFQARWYWLASQPDGVGNSGTMHRITMAYGYLGIIETMVQDLASGLVADDPEFPWDEWRRAWQHDATAAPN